MTVDQAQTAKFLMILLLKPYGIISIIFYWSKWLQVSSPVTGGGRVLGSMSQWGKSFKHTKARN